MTREKLKKILQKGEGIDIEFKTSQFELNKDAFESASPSNWDVGRAKIVKLIFVNQYISASEMSETIGISQRAASIQVHPNYMGAPTQIRLYDDNFSVWNDGSLPEGITEEDLRKVHRSKPRNPLIADTCFKAGYIDSWGRGTIKIIESCKEAGLPEPVLKEEQGGFLSKIFKDRFTEEQLKKLGLSGRQVQAILYTKKYGEITNSKYQEVTDVSKATATRDLKELEDKGFLRNIGTKGSSAKYKLAVGS